MQLIDYIRLDFGDNGQQLPGLSNKLRFQLLNYRRLCPFKGSWHRRRFANTVPSSVTPFSRVSFKLEGPETQAWQLSMLWQAQQAYIVCACTSRANRF